MWNDGKEGGDGGNIMKGVVVGKELKVVDKESKLN
jgi:hypothetical protein